MEHVYGFGSTVAATGAGVGDFGRGVV